MSIARGIVLSVVAALSASCRAPALVVDEPSRALVNALTSRAKQPPSAAEMRASSPRRVIHADGRVTWDVVVYRWCDDVMAWITVGRLELAESDVTCAHDELERAINGDRPGARVVAR